MSVPALGGVGGKGSAFFRLFHGMKVTSFLICSKHSSSLSA